MSALPPKADIAGRQADVRFVPKADSCTAAIYATLTPNARAYGRNQEPRAERVERLTPSVLLLQIDGLVMSSLVELCAPHLVHALVVGPAEDHGRAESNVEVTQIFQSPD